MYFPGEARQYFILSSISSMDALFLIVSKMTACENCHVRFCFNIDKTDSCRAFFFCKVSMAQTILEMFVVDGLKNKNSRQKEPTTISGKRASLRTEPSINALENAFLCSIFIFILALTVRELRSLRLPRSFLSPLSSIFANSATREPPCGSPRALYFHRAMAAGRLTVAIDPGWLGMRQ